MKLQLPGLWGIWKSRDRSDFLRGEAAFVFIFPTSAIEISSAQMLADAGQLAVLPAFCPLVDHKRVTEVGLLNFPFVFQCFQRTGKFLFWNTGFRMLISYWALVKASDIPSRIESLNLVCPETTLENILSCSHLYAHPFHGSEG